MTGFFSCMPATLTERSGAGDVAGEVIVSPPPPLGHVFAQKRESRFQPRNPVKPLAGTRVLPRWACSALRARIHEGTRHGEKPAKLRSERDRWPAKEH